jgi:hypothetical protein
MNDRIVERNLDLATSVTRFILEHPHILDRLPSDFRLVILPDDDRELSQYNLDLLAKRTDQDKPVVIVRLAAHQANFESSPPQVYIPLAA